MSEVSSVTPPMGDRRHPAASGAPLALNAPTPLATYPNIPPPIQPSAPGAVAPTPTSTPADTDVPVQLQAVIVDALRQRIPFSTMQQHFPVLHLEGVTKLAATYGLAFYAVDGQAPIMPPMAPPSFQAANAPPSVVTVPAFVTPVATVAPQAAPQQAAPAKAAARKVTKHDYGPIGKLRAEGKDTSAIAQRLGLSPDAVHRAFKKLDADAAEAATHKVEDARSPGAPPADPRQIPLPHTAPAFLANTEAGGRAAELGPGNLIHGVADVSPLERPMLQARGLDCAWSEELRCWRVYQPTGGAVTVTHVEMAEQHLTMPLPAQVIATAPATEAFIARMAIPENQFGGISKTAVPQTGVVMGPPRPAPTYEVHPADSTAGLPTITVTTPEQAAALKAFARIAAEAVEAEYQGARRTVSEHEDNIGNTIGSWLNARQQTMNEKLEKYGLEVEFVISIR